MVGEGGLTNPCLSLLVSLSMELWLGYLVSGSVCR